MNKFSGIIGYTSTIEQKPGVWVDSIVEKKIIGDVIKNTSKLIDDGKINQDINISNMVSIVLDNQINQFFHSIKYIKFQGIAWSVKTIELQYPRIILTLGGKYNV